jgi:hypothetical protein
MKFFAKALLMVMVGALLSCGKSGKDTAGDPVTEDTNQALYNQVMDIHDEVMPKMEDLYRLKKKLKDSVTNTPGMTEATKAVLGQSIQVYDSAGNAMMVWMRQFNPPMDSANEEVLREYLENQLESVKKMREQVMQALDNQK